MDTPIPCWPDSSYEICVEARHQTRAETIALFENIIEQLRANEFAERSQGHVGRGGSFTVQIGPRVLTDRERIERIERKIEILFSTSETEMRDHAREVAKAVSEAGL